MAVSLQRQRDHLDKTDKFSYKICANLWSSTSYLQLLRRLKALFTEVMKLFILLCLVVAVAADFGEFQKKRGRKYKNAEEALQAKGHYKRHRRSHSLLATTSSLTGTTPRSSPSSAKPSPLEANEPSRLPTPSQLELLAATTLPRCNRLSTKARAVVAGLSQLSLNSRVSTRKIRTATWCHRNI